MVPANLASFADVDALVEWITSPWCEEAGGQRTELQPGPHADAAVPVRGRRRCRATPPTPARRAEVEIRILLWSVERLVTGLAAQGADHDIGRRLHVVLPGSPNRGMFGGDGAYGEAKAALDAFVHAGTPSPTGPTASRWPTPSSAGSAAPA